jgi:hypothetical protein
MSVPTTAQLRAGTQIDSDCVFAAFLAQIAAFIAFLDDFWRFCVFQPGKARL